MAIHTSHDTPILAVYDRRRALILLRDGTPTQLLRDLHQGQFGTHLSQLQVSELHELLLAWEQRALGSMSLRDAFLVDPERGARVYDLICSDLVVARAPVSAALAAAVPELPADLSQLPAPLSSDQELAQLATKAQQNNLALAWLTRSAHFPVPANLDSILPDPPQPIPDEPPFEAPTGRRRSIAAGLAALGVTMLVVPLLSGRIPESPARWPLALLTVALMIGIRAGPAGYLGAACIWMVANLPGFRHGISLQQLWPAPLLLSIGLLALGADRQVRLMWHWIRQRFHRRS